MKMMKYETNKYIQELITGLFEYVL